MQADIPASTHRPIPLFAVSTVDLEHRRTDFIRMLRSLPQDLYLVAVVRGSVEPDAEVLSCMPAEHAVIRVPTASLSDARNVGLDHIELKGVSSDSVICFPDDDCEWSTSTADAVRRAFQDQSTGLILGRYRPDDSAFDPLIYPDDRRPLTPRLVLRRCASIVMFSRVRLALDLRFDTRLGVGAGMPAGEDTDFALRALTVTQSAFYEPDVVCFHRYQTAPVPDRELVAGFIIGKHSRRFPSLTPHIGSWLGRRLIHGPNRWRSAAMVMRGLMDRPTTMHS